jgi:lipoyl(octanoyl) transferase
MGTVAVKRLGVVPYARGLELQEQAARPLRAGRDAPEVLLVLQHEPVITLGRNAGREDVRLDDEELCRRGLLVVQTDRGGHATLHSPGQIVVYPVLHLPRRGLGPARLVELLEEAMIETCRTFGVAAGRLPPHPGVWVDAAAGKPARKVGAIGLRISGGVSTHGIAFNATNDLRLFEAIVPCGLPGFGVTSLAVELARPVTLAAVEDALVWAVQSELVECEAQRTAPHARVAAPAQRRGAQD